MRLLTPRPEFRKRVAPCLQPTWQNASDVKLRKAYGFADVAWHVPNVVDSKFNIGSLTKQFTGMAVLQLLVARKL